MGNIAITPLALRVAAWGALVIEILTVLAGSFLLYTLIKRGGGGKVRLKLLIGMVISDIGLGAVALVTTVAYLADRPFATGSRACDAFGFMLTAVLFTQHVWTLGLALSTYFLLKYPLHRLTSLIDRFWYAIPIIVWVTSLLQSGIWWALSPGFNSQGYVCYYSAEASPLARDLVQFVPRAFVFFMIIVLYSQLFKFLRRPDTIQVSSTEGYDTEWTNQYEVNEQRRRSSYKLEDDDDVANPVSEMGPMDALPLRTLPGEVPPWERLHVNTGEGTPKPAENYRTTSRSAHTPKIHPTDFPVPRQLISASAAPDLCLIDGVLAEDVERKASEGSSTAVGTQNPSLKAQSSRSSGQLPHAPYSLDKPQNTQPLTYGRSPSEADDADDVDRSLMVSSWPADTAVEVDHSEKSRETVADSDSFDDIERPSGTRRQTLQEFFAQYQLTAEELDAAAARQEGAAHHDRPRTSAAHYFNRQASLLMLYFPIVYLLVFAFSLVRLIYDMSTYQPNAVLTILSLWMTLSVGLLDALVYGLAEYIVRRRVRRKMPEKFHADR